MSQGEELTTDPDRAPAGILARDARDEISSFLSDLAAAPSFLTALPPPVPAPALPVPAHDGIRFEDDQRRAPTGPTSEERDPEQTVCAVHPGPAAAHRKLMPKGEVFENEILSGIEQPADRRNQ